MNLTDAQLRGQVEHLPAPWRDALRAACARSPHVDLALLLALGSRETGLRNVLGDGGHGRGMFQEDDRWLPGWLRSTPGCKQGTSTPVVPHRSALTVGLVPTVGAGARKCVAIIEANVGEAKRANVPAGHRTHVAVAGYNAGMHGAIQSYRLHGSPDVATAHEDYGVDVLGRARALRRMLG